MPEAGSVAAAAAAINDGGPVALLVGQGARHARTEVLELAARLRAPMVLSLKAKEGLEEDNEFEVGQSGLLGNPATATAFDGCETLVLVGTDFPYQDFLPQGRTVVQIDSRGSHIGRRVPVTHPVVGDALLSVRELLPLLDARDDDGLLDEARSTYAGWRARQQELADPAYEKKPKGLLRRKVDNPDAKIRPELLAAMVDRHAADDAVFTSDTGMATVWLSRFVRMRGTRRLLGSYNLGSMANAMPQALGAAGLDRQRQVVAFCGDGGLSMLLGDLITAVTHDLPVKLVVFDNGRLGMVKLEMEQAGLPEFGTVLRNPDFARVAQSLGLHGIRVERPQDVEAGVQEALAHPGPVLLDVVTNPDEVALPPEPTLEPGLGLRDRQDPGVRRQRGVNGRMGESTRNPDESSSWPPPRPASPARATPIPRSSATSASSRTSTTASRRSPTACCSSPGSSTSGPRGRSTSTGWTSSASAASRSRARPCGCRGRSRTATTRAPSPGTVRAEHDRHPRPRRLHLRGVPLARGLRGRGAARRRRAGHRGPDAGQPLPGDERRPAHHPGAQQDRPALGASPRSTPRSWPA